MKKIQLILLLIALLAIAGCSEDEKSPSEDSEIVTDDGLSIKVTDEDVKPEEVESDEGYHILELNVFSDVESYYWATNTNFKTVGEAFDNELKHNEEFFTLEETESGRVITEFHGIKNEGDNKWLILSIECENGEEVCLVNGDVDSLKIDKDLQYSIVYGSEKDYE